MQQCAVFSAEVCSVQCSSVQWSVQRVLQQCAGLRATPAPQGHPHIWTGGQDNPAPAPALAPAPAQNELLISLIFLFLAVGHREADVKTVCLCEDMMG